MKRFFKWVVLPGLVCLVLLYAMLMLLPLLSPKVNDSDLQVSRPALTESANGFNALTAAGELLWWPEEQQQELLDLARGTHWNAQLAETVLDRNRKAFAELDAALAAPEFQVPEYDPTAVLDYLSTWKALANLLSLRAEASFNARQEQEAFGQALNMVRLGARMQDSNGPILHYLVGTAVRDIGLNEMRRWLATTKLSPNQLSQFARELANTTSYGSALTNALKAEYQFQIQEIDNMRAGKLPGQNSVPMASIRVLPVYNDRSTRLMFANNTRALLAAASLPCSQANLPSPDKPNPIAMLVTGNAVGKIMFAMMAPVLQVVIKQKCRGQTHLDATRTLLALRAYQLKHGKLPATLDALVPEFLPEVPSDDFDGQPLRFDPVEKRVYSVSTDGKDDEGVESDTQKHLPDYAFQVEF